MARKSKYEEYVKPNLQKITEWSGSGAKDEEICKALGISTSTFYEYKKKYSELSDALRVGRQKVVLNIKAALYKRATGFTYEEKKGIKKDGKQVAVEIYQRYCPPDTTAAQLLLRNYDDTWRDKDATTNDFKEKELKLRQAIAEANNFDFDFKE